MARETLYCRATTLFGMVEHIKQQGGDAKSLLVTAGLSPSVLNDRYGFVAWNNVCYLMELCASVLNNPQFGANWALSLPDEFLHVESNLLIMQLGSDIRSCIELSVAYQKAHTNGVTYSFNEDPLSKITVFSLDFHPASAPHRQAAEYMIMTMARLTRLSGDKLSFDKVNFAHAAPANVGWYDAEFGCPVYFNQIRTELHINPPFIDIKFDPELKMRQPLLKVYWDEAIGNNKSETSPMCDITARTIFAVLGVNKTDINTVAQILNVSPKKLQRLLKEEGMTYTEIRDQTRRERAENLLSHSEISIAYLSRYLDYRTPESFNAACKRWTGLSPQAYRKSKTR